jgi:hypothetical protein
VGEGLGVVLLVLVVVVVVVSAGIIMGSRRWVSPVVVVVAGGALRQRRDRSRLLGAGFRGRGWMSTGGRLRLPGRASRRTALTSTGRLR